MASVANNRSGLADSRFAYPGSGMGDSLTSMLLLDSHGVIVHANPEWFRLVEAMQLAGDGYQAGGDYLAASLSGWGSGLPEIVSHGVSIAAILQGGGQETAAIYSWKIGGERRWFRVSALPLQCLAGSGILVLHCEITADVRFQESLARQAFFDALTDLPNYALFNDRLSQAIVHSSRSGDPLAAMFVDVDEFKAINDTYGHLAGNCVLVEVARRLSGCLRECDTVARLGGDEFGVLLPDMGTRSAAAHVADKMLSALAFPFAIHDGRQFQLTASIGIAFYPEDGMSLDSLMHCADQAMYRSKKLGKNGARHSTCGFCQPDRTFIHAGSLAG